MRPETKACIEEWWIKADKKGIAVHAAQPHFKQFFEKLIPILTYESMKDILECVFHEIEPLTPSKGERATTIGSREMQRFAFRQWLLWRAQNWLNERDFVLRERNKIKEGDVVK